MVEFKFLTHFPVNHLADPDVSRLILLCADLLHSLIIWLMVSSLSAHSLHLLFCWVLSILALISLVLRALSCAAMRRDSVSLLNFPFLSHVQVLLCEILFIINIIIIYSSRVFHISISWWFFTGVWVIASLLKSPGLVSVFWPSSAMLSFLSEWQQVSSNLQNSSKYSGCFE